MTSAAKLITLSEWNYALFGGRYSKNTLRAWCRKGYISPAPIKVGRDWLVKECAEYKKPKKIKIPPNVDLGIEVNDPVIMAILNGR